MPPFKTGMVVSANQIASRVGAKVLKKGGNAVDAAITTAHVLGVAEPAFSGLGGGGFALIWLAQEGKAVFVDFREKGASAATEDMFHLTKGGTVVGNENAVGYKSVAVPGAISGHASILERYGTLRLRETFDEAARIARGGFRVDRTLSYVWKLGAKKLQRFEESRSAYLKRGRPFAEGDRVVLPALARTIRAIARNGPDEFYRGHLAQKVVEDMATNKGLLTAHDLEEYGPTAREPLRGQYKGYEVISAPPPSCGGAIILQSLNMLENLPLRNYGNRSAEGLHMLAEVLARSSMTCRAIISDPAFSNPPMEKLLSKAFATELASTVSLNSSLIPTPAGSSPLAPASNTTHLVAVDTERNIVSLTESVECYFGSGVTVPGTGMILNDTMHDFDPRPGTVNSVGPGKIPMSNMAPTIVLKEGEPVLALGSAGGPRIVSSTLQVLLNVIEYGLELQDAVVAPRIHLDATRLQLEEAVGRGIAKRLQEMGHSIQIKKRTGKEDPGLYFGGVHAAQISEDNFLIGAPDSRRDGLAVGLP